jgi:hypothetical protein
MTIQIGDRVGLNENGLRNKIDKLCPPDVARGLKCGMATVADIDGAVVHVRCVGGKSSVAVGQQWLFVSQNQTIPQEGANV